MDIEQAARAKPHPIAAATLQVVLRLMMLTVIPHEAA
jgi:hypothetical protein